MSVEKYKKIRDEWQDHHWIYYDREMPEDVKAEVDALRREMSVLEAIPEVKEFVDREEAERERRAKENRARFRDAAKQCAARAKSPIAFDVCMREKFEKTKLHEVWFASPIGNMRISHEGQSIFTKERAEEVLIHLKNVSFPQEKDKFYIKEV